MQLTTDTAIDTSIDIVPKQVMCACSVPYVMHMIVMVCVAVVVRINIVLMTLVRCGCLPTDAMHRGCTVGRSITTDDRVYVPHRK